jgi:hypothetical protein
MAGQGSPSSRNSAKTAAGTLSRQSTAKLNNLLASIPHTDPRVAMIKTELTKRGGK